jgi:hypothetical protein
VANKPNRPVNDIVADYNIAIDCNDFDKVDIIERELEDVLRKRLKRLSYEGYPIKKLNFLMELMPEDYNGKQMERLFQLLDNKSLAERVNELG